MHEHLLHPHEVVAVLGDLQIENRLDAGVLNRIDRDDTADCSHAIADLELTGHDPALAGFPETVNSGHHDRVTSDRQFQRRSGFVVVDSQDGLESEQPGSDVLRQNAVADLNQFDLSRAFQRRDLRAGPEARVMAPSSCAGGGSVAKDVYVGFCTGSLGW